MAETRAVRVLPLLLLAAVLNALVCVVRLVGELNGWDPFWFRSEAGSPWSPFGIVWLVPVFGFLLGRRGAQKGGAPRFVKGFFVPMSACFAVLLAIAWVRSLTGADAAAGLDYLMVGAPLLALLALFAWPRMFLWIAGYALIARLPVLVIQYLDVRNGWQTHFGRVMPAMMSLDADERLWLLTELQLALWIPLTILIGCSSAAVGALSVRAH